MEQESREERGVIVFTIGHRMGSSLPFPETGLPGCGEPGTGTQMASPPHAPRLLALPRAVKFFRYFTCISNSVYPSEIYSKDLCLWNYNIMLPICQWAAGKENNFLQFTVMRLQENDAFLSPLSLCMSRYFFFKSSEGRSWWWIPKQIILIIVFQNCQLQSAVHRLSPVTRAVCVTRPSLFSETQPQRSPGTWWTVREDY